MEFRMNNLALGMLAIGCMIGDAGVCGAEILSDSTAMLAGEGYNVYRIPGYKVSADGSVLIFAEGRPSGADPGAVGDIDIVLRRSTDNGETWEDLQLLHHDPGFDLSDPRAILDESTGAMHLMYTRWPTRNGQTGVPVGLGSDSANVFHMSSVDNGVTWTAPKNVTNDVKNPLWAAINTGPGLGIQLKYQDADPSRNGRMIVPAHHRPAAYHGVSLMSDDGGVSWRYGSGSTPNFTDEAEVIELTNGDLLWDGRQGSGGKRNRYVSHDGGETWGEAHGGDIEITRVDSGLVRYSAKRDGDARDMILFSGPLGSSVGDGNSRDNIGVWSSYDEGKTFINPIKIKSGSAAYSVIDKLQDGTIGLVYEIGHKTLQYVNFDLATLEGAQHTHGLSHYEGFGNEINGLRGGVGWSGSWLAPSGRGTVPIRLKSGDIGFNDADDVRVDVDGKHIYLSSNTMRRGLGEGRINLGEDGDTYVSLFVRHASTDGVDSASDEQLEVMLRDGDEDTVVSFGIGSGEKVFGKGIDGSVISGSDSIARDTDYLLLFKVDAGVAGDQVMVAMFDDLLDIPVDESLINWEVVGGVGFDSDALIENIAIEAGENSDWHLDGLRIGRSYDSVVFAVPEPASLSMLGLGGVAMLRRRK